MPSTDPFFVPAGSWSHAPPAREEELRGAASRPLLGGYDLQRVIAESSVAVVYAATDLALRTPVAVKEYLPLRLARRHSASLVVAMPAQAAPYERGLQVFLEEARTLARCDHPSLLRVTRLIEENGTAYRVMPRLAGERLADVRRRRGVPPAEPMLRAWLEALLGALETYHAVGGAHGRVTPDNILLLPDDRPLLLGPGAVGQALDVDRRESALHAARDSRFERDATDDVHQLARTACFCITGHGSPERGRADDEPLRAALERMQVGAYDPALLDALEAAASPDVARRPGSIDAFREWLVLGPPRPRPSVAPSPVPEPVAAIPEVPPAQIDQPSPASAMPAPGPASGAVRPDPNREAAFLGPSFEMRGVAREDADTEPMLVDLEAHGEDTQPLNEPMPGWLRDARPDAGSSIGAAASRPVARRRSRLRTWLVPAAVLALLFAGALAWLAIDQPVRVAGWTREQVAPLVPELTPRDRAAVPHSDAMPPAAPTAAAPPTPEPVPAPAPAPEATARSVQSPVEAPVARAPLLPAAPTVQDAPVADASPAAPAVARSDAAAAPPPPKPSTHPAPSRPTETRGAARPAAVHSTAARSTPSSKGNPADACSGRTPFARYRCIEAQCAQARWSTHAQCLRFRRTGEVD